MLGCGARQVNEDKSNPSPDNGADRSSRVLERHASRHPFNCQVVLEIELWKVTPISKTVTAPGRGTGNSHSCAHCFKLS